MGIALSWGKLQFFLSYMGRCGTDEQKEPFHLGAQGPSNPFSKPHCCPGPWVTFNVTECQSWQGSQHLSILILAILDRLGKTLGSSQIVI